MNAQDRGTSARRHLGRACQEAVHRRPIGAGRRETLDRRDCHRAKYFIVDPGYAFERRRTHDEQLCGIVGLALQHNDRAVRRQVERRDGPFPRDEPLHLATVQGHARQVTIPGILEKVEHRVSIRAESGRCPVPVEVRPK